jgi:ArsR family transcriptional regulator
LSISTAYWSDDHLHRRQAPASPPLADACCAPLLREPITASQAADLARLLKALAGPARLQLVSMVAAREDGEACVCDAEAQVSC